MIPGVQAAVAAWDRGKAKVRVAEAEALRHQFVERFPLDTWPSLPVESYALGQAEGTVCHWLEFRANAIGSIKGGSANKHLIYLSKNGDWRFPKEYASLEAAWDAVRAGFVEIFDLAAEGEFDSVDAVGALAGARALRTKALYMYFPDEIVPVFALQHINRFVRALGQPVQKWSTVQANRALLTALRAVPGLADFATQELGFFLYDWAPPTPTTRAFKIAPGQSARFWDDCLANGYICVGWDEVGDLSLFDSKEAFRDVFATHYPYKGSTQQISRKANELWTLMELEPGDRVVANRGASEILAIGTVNDAGYVWLPEREEYRHTVGVDWDTSFAGPIGPVPAWKTTTVAKIKPDVWRRISGDGVVPSTEDVDGIYLDIEAALQRRGQVILYGPPGTGKTFHARNASVWLLEGGSGNSAAADVLADAAELRRCEEHLVAGRPAARQVWFMVANPSHWPWKRLFEDQSVTYGHGRLARNYPNVRAGDLVVGYESTPTKRIVALGRVTREFDANEPPEEALVLEPVSAVKNGPTYEELQADPLLSQSEPLRFRCQGTLFELTSAEADVLLKQLAERDPSLEGVSELSERSVPHLTRVTFHPSYTYEDFVEGFRPAPTGDGALKLVLTDGIFKRVCDAARTDPDNPYVLVIDEINRGNIPKIFGELITLIERDKRGMKVRLPQSGTDFSVPENVWLIGTMNTADRSIHLLDTALRRRFAFIELLPDSDVLEGATAGALPLAAFLDELNSRIRARVGRERQVGHSVFFVGNELIDSAEAFAAVFRGELLPLLQEYLYEDYKDLADLLGPVIDSEAERVAPIVDDPELLCSKLASHFKVETTP